LLRAIPRWAWWALAAAGFVTLILLVVLWFPRLLRPDLSDVERDRLAQQGTDKLVAAENDRSNAQNSIRTTLLQGIAGVALLTGAYFAYRGLEASRLQLKATEDGQITTRYTEAVKQLGDKENDDIRIGGIYALQRIAGDSDGDLPTVVALLSAFVRRSVPVKEVADGDRPEGTSLSAQAPDVEIALAVLAALGGAHLFAANLGGANLVGADLSRANLTGANLKDADLSGANLSAASLHRANLSDARLIAASLHRADLSDANLGGANLFAANVGGADLFGASLIGADLTGADLRGADLRDADLSDADFRATVADLSGSRGTPKLLWDASPGSPARERDQDEDDDDPK
jgi:hypothetical protein